MHKIANEVTFANQQMVERIFSRMRDGEYADTVATLSAIHDLMSQQADLSVIDATKEVIGDNNFVQGFARYITHYIGEGQFRGVPFESLSESLYAFRAPAAIPEGEQVPEAATTEPAEEEGLSKPDFAEDLERIKTQKYPEAERERVMMSFKNLGLHLKKLHEATEEGDVELYAEQIRGTIEFLDSLVKYAPLDKKDESDPDSKKKGPSKKRGSKVVKAGETNLSEEDVANRMDTRVRVQEIPATLSMETLGSHAIVRGIEIVSETGLTTETIRQTEESLVQVMNNAKKAFVHFEQLTSGMIERHRQTRTKGKGSDKADSKVSNSVLIDFNNLIYAIKGVDLFVKKAIRAAIMDPENSISGVELAGLRDKLLVPQFVADKAFFSETIVLGLSYLAVRDVGLLYAGIKTWGDFEGDTYSSVVEDYGKDLHGGRSLEDDTTEYIFKLMWSKFRRMLSATSTDQAVNDSDPMKNFISNVLFQKGFVAQNLRRDLRSSESSKVNIAKCPTCTRPIKWSGKPLKDLDLIQSRGAYLPMYSFVGKRLKDDGRKTSFIITERHLEEGGPYPAPDSSKIGNASQMNETKADGSLTNKAKLLKRTRSVIDSYEGSKTWSEILELLYSNEPAEHEEGLQRRAGALAHLGAVRLRHKRKGGAGVPVMTDISTIMYACPFQKEEAETGFSKSDIFSPKDEITKIKTELQYPDDPETQAAVGAIFDKIDELNLSFAEAVMNDPDIEALIRGELEEAFDQAYDLAGVVRGEDEAEEEGEVGPAFSPSGCGLKLSPYEDDPSKMTYGSNSNPNVLQYTWNPREFDETQEAAAQKSLSGGYKFSKTIFRCPARIVDPSSTDLIKYKNVAIPKSGPSGIGSGAYVPPTNASGYAAYDEIENGTFSYLVCGASTSLSAFDKTSGGEGSIYTILRNLLNVIKGSSATGESVTNSQKNAAKNIIDFLILEGIDYMDLIKALEVADAPEPELATTARLKKCRIKKIEKMLVTAARQLPSQFSEIEELVLVCPHGHRFSLKQSVGFSETHVSVRMSGANKGYAAAKELYALTGIESLEAAKRIGVIVRAVDEEELKTFEDIGSENHSVEELAFVIPDELGNPVRWKFSPRITDLIKKNAFSEYPGAGQEDIPSSIEYSKVKFGGQFLADLIKEGAGSGSEEEIAAGKQAAADYRRDEDAGSETLSRAIEGIDSKDLASNIEALARSLRGALKIVITWNNRAIEPEFFNKVVANSDFSIEGVPEEILSIDGLFYTEDDGLDSAALSAVLTAFAPRLKTYIVATNAFQGEDYVGSATALATAALVDAVVQVANDTEHDIEFDLDLDSDNTEFEFVYAKLASFFEDYRADFQKLIPYITHSDERYVAKAQEIASKTPVLSIFYTIASYRTEKKGQERTRLREAYGKKIFLVAYARYLANAIAVVYNECMAPGRCIPGAYIGYNIGVDLSTTDKVLALTSGDLRIIEDNPNLRGANHGIVLRNVVAAYNGIIARMSIARNMAISPIGLAEAKKELLRQSGTSGDPLAHAVFSSAFPMQTVDFGMENLTYGSGNIPNAFGIRAGKGRALPSELHESEEEGVEPAVLPPAMLPVTRRDGSPVLDRAGQQKVIPAYLHPDSGFDSSKFQIGMCMGKTGKSLTWPLDHASDFVGFPLPFNRDKTATVTRAADAAVYDFRFVIDIEGVPQDISFLFRRGRMTKEEDGERKNKYLPILRELYSKLDTFEDQRGDALEDAKNSEEEDAINNHFDDAIRETQSALKQIPLFIKAGKSYVRNKASLGSSEPKWISEAHPTALLVAPNEALNLIKNVERFAGMLSVAPNQELLERFVIQVYGLGVVRDIVQEAQNKYTDEIAEIRAEDIFDTHIDGNTSSGKKMLSHINSSLSKVYSEHLGQYYDLIPSGADGTGSNLVLLEASVPSFKENRRSESGFEVVPDEGLGTPPSIGKLASRMNKNNSISDFFGRGAEGDVGMTYLQKAQESMIEYVKGHASGELGSHTTEASLKTEYLKKIAKRRKSWERMMLTMGEADIEVDDLVG